MSLGMLPSEKGAAISNQTLFYLYTERASTEALENAAALGANVQLHAITVSVLRRVVQCLTAESLGDACKHTNVRKLTA